jgi:hypothetical protein
VKLIPCIPCWSPLRSDESLILFLLSPIYSLLVILGNRIPFTHRKEDSHTHTIGTNFSLPMKATYYST